MIMNIAGRHQGASPSAAQLQATLSKYGGSTAGRSQQQGSGVDGEETTSSTPLETLERVLQAAVLLLTVVAVVLLIVEAEPEFYDRQLVGFFVAESVTVAIFTIDLLLRFSVASDKIAFWKSPLNWIDLIAVVPYYIEIILKYGASSSSNLSALVVLRVLRLTRAFRIFKIGQTNKELMLVTETLMKSTHALSLLFFLLIVVVILFSTLMFLVETRLHSSFSAIERRWIRGDGTVSPFQSIPATFWWGCVTITTVGYGEPDVPITSGGKVVASLCILSGILVLGFPVILITATYSDVITTYETELLLGLITSNGSPRAMSPGQEFPRLLAPDAIYAQTEASDNEGTGLTVCGFRAGSTMCHMPWGANNIAVQCSSVCPQDGSLQVRYPPLFLPVVEDGTLRIRRMESDLVCVLSLFVALEDKNCTKAVLHEVRRACNLQPSQLLPSAVRARSIDTLRVRIDNLPPYFTLLTPQFRFPGSKVNIRVLSPDPSYFEQLCDCMPNCRLEFSGEYLPLGSESTPVETIVGNPALSSMRSAQRTEQFRVTVPLDITEQE